MAAMNRVLWPVTWGRYITDLLAPEEGPSILAPDKHLAIREFFCEHVRGGAPLPTLARRPASVRPAADHATRQRRHALARAAVRARGRAARAARALARVASRACSDWIRSTARPMRSRWRCSGSCRTRSASWSAGSTSSGTSERASGRRCGRPRKAPTSAISARALRAGPFIIGVRRRHLDRRRAGGADVLPGNADALRASTGELRRGCSPSSDRHRPVRGPSRPPDAAQRVVPGRHQRRLQRDGHDRPEDLLLGLFGPRGGRALHPWPRHQLRLRPLPST